MRSPCPAWGAKTSRATSSWPRAASCGWAWRASDGPGLFLHSPHFDIDERALVIGAKVLAHGVVLLAEMFGSTRS